MKIIIKKYEDKYDYLMFHKLIIDGKEMQTIGRCEPEDAIIGRDLIDADEIVAYMKSAFEAAKKGEKLEIETIECKTSEEFWGY